MNKLKIRANAKINLSLSVLAPRADGYHEIDTVMQSISLHDTVLIGKSDRVSVECENLSDGSNIAFRAAELFFEKTGINAGAEIKIEKRIPAAAGLGGGSADAAAVLVGLDRIYGTGLSCRVLLELSVRLGADVPFLIRGGTARARGIGERLEPLRGLRDCYFLIAKAQDKPSTGEMFRRLDAAAYGKPDIAGTAAALNAGDYRAAVSSFDNSFAVLWRESSVKKHLFETGADAVSLSGSGPAWFAVYREKGKAAAAERALKSLNTACFLCTPSEQSIVIE